MGKSVPINEINESCSYANVYNYEYVLQFEL